MQASRTHDVTKAEITDGLRGLGIGTGDTLFVHSSLKAFGRVVGGAEAVVDGLLEAVGPRGNVVMPTFSSNREDVPKTPEEDAMGMSFKFRVLPYDPVNDGCWTGVIADTFRKKPGAVRGSHPAYSLTASGPRAVELATDLEYYRGVDCWIVLLGVGLDVCSAMRLAKDEAKLPADLHERITPPPALKARYDREKIIFGYGPYPDYGVLERDALETGALVEGRIGAASAKVGRLKELLELFGRRLRDDPYRFFKRAGISPRYDHLAGKSSRAK